ncbi:hypothetical protein D3C72_2154110 [compost metagenome]
MTMSPRLSTAPMVSLALTSGVRSGCLYSSIGVGTVTMNTLAWPSSARSAVYVSWAASVSSASLTSSVWSCPAFSASMRRVLISNPMTERFLPNSTARGRPT